MSKYEWAMIALWLIAMLATLYVTRDTGLFTFLGPVFFICLSGSILIVRNARRRTP
jgi:hypothetical protein